MVPDIGDPAAVLLVNKRLIGAAPLKVAVADEGHIARLRLVLRQPGGGQGGNYQCRENCNVADQGTLPCCASASSRSKPLRRRFRWTEQVRISIDMIATSWKLYRITEFYIARRS
jgi:hypothetical protein